MMKRILTMLVLLGALLPGHVFADSVRAWLDRDTMQLGETVTLNIEVDGGTSAAPDFSVLDNDFKSLGTQSNRQFSMTNGQATAKTIWAIGLEPKRAGTLEIPALAVGSASTTALRLTVLPAPTGSEGKAGDNVYIEVTAEPLAPYVQQQVRYVVKLYYAVDLTEGALDEPVADGVVVQKLGRDRQYNATVGERRYNVLERRYALIAERSGRLTMPPLAFRGSTLDSADPTGFFRRGRAISARSDAVELDVRAKPAEWGAAPWLPAASFTISDESSLPDEVPVGEPITRTVRLRAQGLGFEQLPELEFDAPPGSEIYPDKPDTQTRDDGSWLFGERTRKFAVVATRPGKIVLPAMQVDWWDTTLDRRVTAVLPAHEINVVAAAGAASSSPVAPPPALRSTADAPAASVMYPSTGGDSGTRTWRSLALGMLALWLVTLAAWWRSRRTSPVSLGTAAVPLPPHPGRATFLRASATGDLAEAERALLGWARSERPALRNIGEIIAQLGGDDQRAALDDLLRVRYAGAQVEGIGTRLARVFRDGFTWAAASHASAEPSPLPSLYRDHD